MSSQPIVFIVDDEPIVRKAIKGSVESLGARVVCFPTAELCLEALQSEHCDLVITDVNMPEFDGVALLNAIRERHALVPVLIMTGYGSVPLAVKAMQLGAVDFIEKPLDEAILLPRVERFIRQTGVGSAAEEGLSPVEERVLELVADGKANKEIAYILGRSVRTVENHRHRLMKKLGASSTADLVKFVLRRSGKKR